jgi:hypothetical protein
MGQKMGIYLQEEYWEMLREKSASEDRSINNLIKRAIEQAYGVPPKKPATTAAQPEPQAA